MSQFDGAIATATRLIKKYGQKVTWVQVKDGANPSQPWKPAAANDTNKTVYICFVSAKDNEWRKFLATLTGTEVPVGKLAGIMAGGLSFEPTLKDKVVRAGKTLTVTNIDVIAPNEQKVLYTLEFQE